MTLNDFYKWMQNPELLGENQIQELRVLSDRYPAFSPVKMMLVKALQNTGSVYLQDEIRRNTIYTPDVRKFFYYLYPEEKLNEVQFKRDEKYSGNYFDMLNIAGVSDSNQDNSLKKLAEKLKVARTMITEQNNTENVDSDKKEIVIPVIDYFKLENNPSEKNEELLEQQYKNLIRQKKYAEALQTLKELNLINPKKSIYFADQIRFLEKVLNIQYN